MKKPNEAWKIKLHLLPDFEYVYHCLRDDWDSYSDPDDMDIPYLGGAEIIGGMAKIHQDGKYGFCDRYGNKAVHCLYDYAGKFYNDLCIVGTGGKYGIIDCGGNVVVPLIHDSLSIDYESSAASHVFVLPNKRLVEMRNRVEGLDVPLYPYTGKNLRYLLEVDDIIDYRPDVFWADPKRVIIRNGRRHGVVDMEGNICAPFIYDDIRSNGFAFRDGKWGLLDAYGREAAPFHWDSPEDCAASNTWADIQSVDDQFSVEVTSSNSYEGLFHNHIIGPFMQVSQLIRPKRYTDTGFWGRGEKDGAKRFYPYGFWRAPWDSPRDGQAFYAYGIQNYFSGEIVLPMVYRYLFLANGIKTERYDGLTAYRDGRWYFVELLIENGNNNNNQ